MTVHATPLQLRSMYLGHTYVPPAPPTSAQPMYFWPLPPWPNLCTSGPTYKTVSSVRALCDETNEEEVHGV